MRAREWGERAHNRRLDDVNERALVKQLLGRPDGAVSVSGWVETVRDQKKVQFIVLRDESGAVQLVNPATRELPEGEAPTAAEPGGPEIDFVTTAPTPGRYLLYLDVKVDGQVHTAPLVVDTAGSSPAGSTATPSTSHGDTDHDH